MSEAEPGKFAYSFSELTQRAVCFTDPSQRGFKENPHELLGYTREAAGIDFTELSGSFEALPKVRGKTARRTQLVDFLKGFTFPRLLGIAAYSPTFFEIGIPESVVRGALSELAISESEAIHRELAGEPKPDSTSAEYIIWSKKYDRRARLIAFANNINAPADSGRSRRR